MSIHAATCRTPGCGNEGFTLILSNPGHTIICGPCGVQIEDVEPQEIIVEPSHEEDE